jgi:HD domain-containing protein
MRSCRPRQSGHASSPCATRPAPSEVLLCACLLHDIGAYGVAPLGDAHTAEGRRFALQLLEPFAWPEIRIRACGDAIEHHHELSPVWELGPETEVLRRADLVDVTAGVVAFDLSRGWLRGLFRGAPAPAAAFYPYGGVNAAVVVP